MPDTNLGIIVNHKQKSYDYFHQFFAKTTTITTENHMILVWIYQRLNHMIVQVYNHMIIHVYHHMTCMNNYHMNFYWQNHMISIENYHIKNLFTYLYDFASIQSYSYRIEKSYDF